MSGQWRRLDPRVIAALAALVCGPAVPAGAVMLLAGAPAVALGWTFGVWLLVAVLAVAARAVAWRVSSYRIGAERVELRTGLLARRHRSLPRDRIRSVDLTADPLHRVLGLSVVRIGTGAQDEELRLDAVRRAEAEAIRAGLLARVESTSDDPAAGGVLARLDPAWLPYSALTMSLVLAVWGAIGSAFGSFSELFQKAGLYREAGELFEAVPLWLFLGVPVGALLVVGVLGALLLSLELWWGFTLTREEAGALRVRRGLLTRRSISLEERRLRGVEVAEPLLLRWFGGARTHAVATGLSERSGGEHQPDAKTLLPPAPRAAAVRVAAAVLREPEFPEADLRPHPRAALRRRITWGLLGAAPFPSAAVVAAVLGWTPAWVPIPVLVVAAAIGIAAGVSAYRGLGHALRGPYLVARRGTGVRRTVALQRSGIVGWRFARSIFQRRAGLVDVVATTAAGSGRVVVPDVALADGAALADAAVPGLLTPFLERNCGASDSRRGPVRRNAPENSE